MKPSTSQRILKPICRTFYAETAAVLLFLLFLPGILHAQCNPTYSGNPCVGTILNFKANAPGYTTWSWDFDDGNYSSQRDPGYIFSEPGTYLVEVTASSPTLGTCKKSIQVTVLPSPKLHVLLNSPVEQCYEGNFYCFTDSSSPAPGSHVVRATYLFDDGDMYETTDPNLPQDFCKDHFADVSFTFRRELWYGLYVELEDANGCIAKEYMDSIAHVHRGIGASIVAANCRSTDGFITNQTYVNWRRDSLRSIGLRDISSFVLDLGDTIIYGDSVTNTEYWTGEKRDGVINHTFDRSNPYYPSLYVYSKYGCADTSIATIPIVTCVQGNVYIDLNANCLPDNSAPAQNLMLRAGNVYTITDDEGNFSIPVPDSTTNRLEVVVPDNWQPLMNSICPASYPIFFPAGLTIDTTGFDFALDMDTCPMLSVQVETGRRRSCTGNWTYLKYINKGVSTAENVIIKVDLSDYVIPISSSRPFTLDEDSMLVFEIGSLGINEGGTIALLEKVKCGLMGEIVCTKAFILPENKCLHNRDTIRSLWDGAVISVDGRCNPDGSHRFVLTNTGASAMDEISTYNVYIDGNRRYSSVFQLGYQDSMTLDIPESDQSKIAVEAFQTEHYPGFHKFQVLEIANCTDFKRQLEIDNIYAMRSSNDLPEFDETCSRIRNSYDPNDKTVQPEGNGENHTIAPVNTLRYRIRFQNTGNDTAYKVVIRDRLSEHLDVSSLQMGASSHPYTLTFGDNPLSTELIFTFNDINLVDSGTDEINSQGFVSFDIRPKNPEARDYSIHNAADIYFDFNSPIHTNDAWVYIQEEEKPSGKPITIIENGKILQYVTEIMAMACNEITSPSGKYSWTASGEYLDTLPGSTGFDSILIVDLTVTRIDTSVTQNGNTLSAVQVNASYQWLDCDRDLEAIPNEIFREYTVPASGRYAVELRYNGCIDTSQCIYVEKVGVTGPEATHGIIVYPNPTDGTISVQLGAGFNDVKVLITDAEGRTIAEKTAGYCEELDMTLDTKPGFYILEVSSSGRIIGRFKLIKEN